MTTAVAGTFAASIAAEGTAIVSTLERISRIGADKKEDAL